MSMLENIVPKLSNLLSLDSADPNKNVLDGALSLDASNLDLVPRKVLLGYLVALGQHLITLKFAENLKSAVYANINKVFEHKLNSKLVHFDDEYPQFKKKTVKEKKAHILNKDEELIALNEKLQVAEIELSIVSGMSKPVEEYVQVLKKVLDSKPADV